MAQDSEVPPLPVVGEAQQQRAERERKTKETLERLLVRLAIKRLKERRRS